MSGLRKFGRRIGNQERDDGPETRFCVRMVFWQSAAPGKVRLAALFASSLMTSFWPSDPVQLGAGSVAGGTGPASINRLDIAVSICASA